MSGFVSNSRYEVDPVHLPGSFLMYIFSFFTGSLICGLARDSSRLFP